MLEAMRSGLEANGDFKVIAIGGATRNAFWMQNKADVTGCRIETPEIHEATALGAALLAGIGAGIYRNETDAFEHVEKPARVFEPNDNLSPKYRRWYRTYKQLYPAMRAINSELYETRAGACFERE